ncbi:DUF2948 family protein [Alphaproteobacteria bacterium]|nr:DUF2948 family protein [Alphaproteobacteria bacterium]
MDAEKKKHIQKLQGAIFLRCQQASDILVLSSLLQDALVSNADFHFDKKDNSFVFVANRFCWETPPIKSEKSENDVYYRVLSGVNIQNVISVKHKNMKQFQDNEGALFYNLLAIEYDNETNDISLVFSDMVGMKISITDLNIFIRDIAEPYPTKHIPNHFDG